MMAGPDSDEGMDLEAAEYVLGTLDDGERAAFAVRLEASAAARQAVARWEERFAPLADYGAPVPPPAETWARIEQAIGVRGAKTLPFRVIQGGATASAPRDFRVSRDRWRAAAVAAGCAALVLLGLLFGHSPAPTQSATYVAAVDRGGGKPALLVTLDPASRRVLVRTIAAAPPPADHSYQLWYIGADAVPQSLGVLQGETDKLTLPPRNDADAAATIAVSLEPLGGSKTGRPTGAVVYSGQLIKE